MGHGAAVTFVLSGALCAFHTLSQAQPPVTKWPKPASSVDTGSAVHLSPSVAQSSVSAGHGEPDGQVVGMEELARGQGSEPCKEPKRTKQEAVQNSLNSGFSSPEFLMLPLPRQVLQGGGGYSHFGPLRATLRPGAHVGLEVFMKHVGRGLSQEIAAAWSAWWRRCVLSSIPAMALHPGSILALLAPSGHPALLIALLRRAVVAMAFGHAARMCSSAVAAHRSRVLYAIRQAASSAPTCSVANAGVAGHAVSTATSSALSSPSLESGVVDIAQGLVPSSPQAVLAHGAVDREISAPELATPLGMVDQHFDMGAIAADGRGAPFPTSPGTAGACSAAPPDERAAVLDSCPCDGSPVPSSGIGFVASTTSPSTVGKPSADHPPHAELNSAELRKTITRENEGLEAFVSVLADSLSSSVESVLGSPDTELLAALSLATGSPEELVRSTLALLTIFQCWVGTFGFFSSLNRLMLPIASRGAALGAVKQAQKGMAQEQAQAIIWAMDQLSVKEGGESAAADQSGQNAGAVRLADRGVALHFSGAATEREAPAKIDPNTPLSHESESSRSGSAIFSVPFVQEDAGRPWSAGQQDSGKPPVGATMQILLCVTQSPFSNQRLSISLSSQGSQRAEKDVLRAARKSAVVSPLDKLADMAHRLAEPETTGIDPSPSEQRSVVNAALRMRRLVTLVSRVLRSQVGEAQAGSALEWCRLMSSVYLPSLRQATAQGTYLGCESMPVRSNSGFSSAGGGDFRQECVWSGQPAADAVVQEWYAADTACAPLRWRSLFQFLQAPEEDSQSGVDAEVEQPFECAPHVLLRRAPKAAEQPLARAVSGVTVVARESSEVAVIPWDDFLRVLRLAAQSRSESSLAAAARHLVCLQRVTTSAMLAGVQALADPARQPLAPLYRVPSDRSFDDVDHSSPGWVSALSSGALPFTTHELLTLSLSQLQRLAEVSAGAMARLLFCLQAEGCLPEAPPFMDPWIAHVPNLEDWQQRLANTGATLPSTPSSTARKNPVPRTMSDRWSAPATTPFPLPPFVPLALPNMLALVELLSTWFDALGIEAVMFNRPLPDMAPSVLSSAMDHNVSPQSTLRTLLSLADQHPRSQTSSTDEFEGTAHLGLHPGIASPQRRGLSSDQSTRIPTHAARAPSESPKRDLSATSADGAPAVRPRTLPLTASFSSLLHLSPSIAAAPASSSTVAQSAALALAGAVDSKSCGPPGVAVHGNARFMAPPPPEADFAAASAALRTHPLHRSAQQVALLVRLLRQVPELQDWPLAACVVLSCRLGYRMYPGQRVLQAQGAQQSPELFIVLSGRLIARAKQTEVAQDAKAARAVSESAALTRALLCPFKAGDSVSPEDLEHSMTVERVVGRQVALYKAGDVVGSAALLADAVTHPAPPAGSWVAHSVACTYSDTMHSVSTALRVGLDNALRGSSAGARLVAKAGLARPGDSTSVCQAAKQATEALRSASTNAAGETVRASSASFSLKSPGSPMQRGSDGRSRAGDGFYRGEARSSGDPHAAESRPTDHRHVKSPKRNPKGGGKPSKRPPKSHCLSHSQAWLRAATLSDASASSIESDASLNPKAEPSQGLAALLSMWSRAAAHPSLLVWWETVGADEVGWLAQGSPVLATRAPVIQNALSAAATAAHSVNILSDEASKVTHRGLLAAAHRDLQAQRQSDVSVGASASQNLVTPSDRAASETSAVPVFDSCDMSMKAVALMRAAGEGGGAAALQVGKGGITHGKEALAQVSSVSLHRTMAANCRDSLRLVDTLGGWRGMARLAGRMAGSRRSRFARASVQSQGLSQQFPVVRELGPHATGLVGDVHSEQRLPVGADSAAVCTEDATRLLLTARHFMLRLAAGVDGESGQISTCKDGSAPLSEHGKGAGEAKQEDAQAGRASMFQRLHHATAPALATSATGQYAGAVYVGAPSSPLIARHTSTLLSGGPVSEEVEVAVLGRGDVEIVRQALHAGMLPTDAEVTEQLLRTCPEVDLGTLLPGLASTTPKTSQSSPGTRSAASPTHKCCAGEAGDDGPTARQSQAKAPVVPRVSDELASEAQDREGAAMASALADAITQSTLSQASEQPQFGPVSREAHAHLVANALVTQPCARSAEQAQQVLSLLLQLPALLPLPMHALRALAGAVQVEELEAEQVLVHEGEQCGFAHVVLAGALVAHSSSQVTKPALADAQTRIPDSSLGEERVPEPSPASPAPKERAGEGLPDREASSSSAGSQAHGAGTPAHATVGVSQASWTAWLRGWQGMRPLGVSLHGSALPLHSVSAALLRAASAGSGGAEDGLYGQDAACGSNPQHELEHPFLPPKGAIPPGGAALHCMLARPGASSGDVVSASLRRGLLPCPHPMVDFHGQSLVQAPARIRAAALWCAGPAQSMAAALHQAIHCTTAAVPEEGVTTPLQKERYLREELRRDEEAFTRAQQVHGGYLATLFPGDCLELALPGSGGLAGEPWAFRPAELSRLVAALGFSDARQVFSGQDLTVHASRAQEPRRPATADSLAPADGHMTALSLMPTVPALKGRSHTILAQGMRSYVLKIPLVVLQREVIEPLLVPRLVPAPTASHMVLYKPPARRTSAEVDLLAMAMQRGVAFFRNLPWDAARALCSDLTLREIPDGQLAVREGDNADDFFIILSGAFTVHKTSIPPLPSPEGGWIPGTPGEAAAPRQRAPRMWGDGSATNDADHLDYEAKWRVRSKDGVFVGRCIAVLAAGEHFGHQALNMLPPAPPSTHTPFSSGQVLIEELNSGRHSASALTPAAARSALRALGAGADAGGDAPTAWAKHDLTRAGSAPHASATSSGKDSHNHAGGAAGTESGDPGGRPAMQPPLPTTSYQPAASTAASSPVDSHGLVTIIASLLVQPRQAPAGGHPTASPLIQAAGDGGAGKRNATVLSAATDGTVVGVVNRSVFKELANEATRPSARTPALNSPAFVARCIATLLLRSEARPSDEVMSLCRLLSAALPGFAHLDIQRQHALARRCRHCHASPGAVLAQRGEMAQHVVLVLHGMLGVFMPARGSGGSKPVPRKRRRGQHRSRPPSAWSGAPEASASTGLSGAELAELLQPSMLYRAGDTVMDAAGLGICVSFLGPGRSVGEQVLQPELTSTATGLMNLSSTVALWDTHGLLIPRDDYLSVLRDSPPAMEDLQALPPLAHEFASSLHPRATETLAASAVLPCLRHAVKRMWWRAMQGKLVAPKALLRPGSNLTTFSTVHPWQGGAGNTPTGGSAGESQTGMPDSSLTGSLSDPRDRQQPRRQTKMALPLDRGRVQSPDRLTPDVSAQPIVASPGRSGTLDLSHAGERDDTPAAEVMDGAAVAFSVSRIHTAPELQQVPEVPEEHTPTSATSSKRHTSPDRASRAAEKRRHLEPLQVSSADLPAARAEGGTGSGPFEPRHHEVDATALRGVLSPFKTRLPMGLTSPHPSGASPGLPQARDPGSDHMHMERRGGVTFAQGGAVVHLHAGESEAESTRGSTPSDLGRVPSAGWSPTELVPEGESARSTPARSHGAVSDTRDSGVVLEGGLSQSGTFAGDRSEFWEGSSASSVGWEPVWQAMTAWCLQPLRQPSAQATVQQYIRALQSSMWSELTNERMSALEMAMTGLQAKSEPGLMDATLPRPPSTVAPSIGEASSATATHGSSLCLTNPLQSVALLIPGQFAPGGSGSEWLGALQGSGSAVRLRQAEASMSETSSAKFGTHSTRHLLSPWLSPGVDVAPGSEQIRLPTEPHSTPPSRTHLAASGPLAPLHRPASSPALDTHIAPFDASRSGELSVAPNLLLASHAGDISVAAGLALWHSTRNAMMQDLVSHLPGFRDMNPQALYASAMQTRYHRVPAGAPLYMPGDPAARFFVVLEGAVELKAGKQTVSVAQAGESFGQHEVLLRCERHLAAFSLGAEEHMLGGRSRKDGSARRRREGVARLVSIPWDIYARYWPDYKFHRSTHRFIMSLPGLQGQSISEEHKALLCHLLTPVAVKRGTKLVQQGSTSPNLYVLQEGSASVRMRMPLPYPAVDAEGGIVMRRAYKVAQVKAALGSLTSRNRGRTALAHGRVDNASILAMLEGNRPPSLHVYMKERKPRQRRHAARSQWARLHTSSSELDDLTTAAEREAELVAKQTRLARHARGAGGRGTLRPPAAHGFPEPEVSLPLFFPSTIKSSLSSATLPLQPQEAVHGSKSDWEDRVDADPRSTDHDDLQDVSSGTNGALQPPAGIFSQQPSASVRASAAPAHSATEPVTIQQRAVTPRERGGKPSSIKAFLRAATTLGWSAGTVHGLQEQASRVLASDAPRDYTVPAQQSLTASKSAPTLSRQQAKELSTRMHSGLSRAAKAPGNQGTGRQGHANRGVHHIAPLATLLRGTGRNSVLRKLAEAADAEREAKANSQQRPTPSRLELKDEPSPLLSREAKQEEARLLLQASPLSSRAAGVGSAQGATLDLAPEAEGAATESLIAGDKALSSEGFRKWQAKRGLSASGNALPGRGIGGKRWWDGGDIRRNLAKVKAAEAGLASPSAPQSVSVAALFRGKDSKADKQAVLDLQRKAAAADATSQDKLLASIAAGGGMRAVRRWHKQAAKVANRHSGQLEAPISRGSLSVLDSSPGDAGAPQPGSGVRRRLGGHSAPAIAGVEVFASHAVSFGRTANVHGSQRLAQTAAAIDIQQRRCLGVSGRLARDILASRKAGQADGVDEPLQARHSGGQVNAQGAALHQFMHAAAATAARKQPVQGANPPHVSSSVNPSSIVPQAIVPTSPNVRQTLWKADAKAERAIAAADRHRVAAAVAALSLGQGVTSAGAGGVASGSFDAVPAACVVPAGGGHQPEVGAATGGVGSTGGHESGIISGKSSLVANLPMELVFGLPPAVQSAGVMAGGTTEVRVGHDASEGGDGSGKEGSALIPRVLVNDELVDVDLASMGAASTCGGGELLLAAGLRLLASGTQRAPGAQLHAKQLHRAVLDPALPCAFTVTVTSETATVLVLPKAGAAALLPPALVRAVSHLLTSAGAWRLDRAEQLYEALGRGSRVPQPAHGTMCQPADSAASAFAGVLGGVDSIPPASPIRGATRFEEGSLRQQLHAEDYTEAAEWDARDEQPGEGGEGWGVAHHVASHWSGAGHHYTLLGAEGGSVDNIPTSQMSLSAVVGPYMGPPSPLGPSERSPAGSLTRLKPMSQAGVASTALSPGLAGPSAALQTSLQASSSAITSRGPGSAPGLGRGTGRALLGSFASPKQGKRPLPSAGRPTEMRTPHPMSAFKARQMTSPSLAFSHQLRMREQHLAETQLRAPTPQVSDPQ